MQWYVFNDFSIESIEKHEVVQFNMEWKIPCVLYYMREDINDHYDIKSRKYFSFQLRVG